MDLLIYAILFAISFVGLIHSMLVDDKCDVTPCTARGKKFIKGYFVVSYCGCALFGFLFFGTILTRW